MRTVYISFASCVISLRLLPPAYYHFIIAYSAMSIKIKLFCDFFYFFLYSNLSIYLSRQIFKQLIRCNRFENITFMKYALSYGDHTSFIIWRVLFFKAWPFSFIYFSWIVKLIKNYSKENKRVVLKFWKNIVYD